MLEINAKYLTEIIDCAINSAQIGICLCDREGIIKYINDGFINILSDSNLKFNKQTLIGKHLNIISKDYEEAFTKLSNEGTISNYEISLTDKSGSIRWLLNDIYAIDGPDNNKIQVTVVRDITIYKKLEIKLIKSETNLESIVRTIPDIVYRVDPEGTITYISDAIQEYGYSPEELIGSNIFHIIHPDDKEKALYKVNERRTGKRRTERFEVRLITKNHDVVTFEFDDKSKKKDQYFLISSEGIYITHDKDDKYFIGSQGVAQDITNKKYIEAELFESKEKWVSILNSLEDGYYEVDLDGNFLFINKSFCEILSYSLEEIIGQNYTRFFPQEDREEVYDTFNRVYRTEEQAKLLNWRAVRKDGKVRNIEGSVSLIKDLQNKSIGFRGIIRDSTDKLRMEQELLRARKLEAIGILAGGIAHDYNNALTAIMGNISLAKMEAQDNSALIEILDDAEKASLKIMDLTKQLSSFAKGGRPDKKIVNLETFIRETVDAFLFNYKGKYTITVQKELWDVEIDEIQISHVIEHVLNNSIEAKPAGGTISIDAKNMTVYEEESHHEITLQPGNYVVITITDDGPGIAKDVIDNVFDPYFTTKDFASGMGLATTYAIIKRHRGYIDIKSPQGKGTIIHLYLPVQK